VNFLYASLKKLMNLKKYLKVTHKMLLTDGISQTDSRLQEMITEILKPVDQHMAQKRQDSRISVAENLKRSFTIDELISIYSGQSEARREAPIFEEINDELQGKLPSAFYVQNQQKPALDLLRGSRAYHEQSIELGEKVLGLLSERSGEVNLVAAYKLEKLESRGVLWL